MQRLDGPRRPTQGREQAHPVKAQIALTVAEGKRLIAKAVVSLPEVENARRHGKILLKGGTTTGRRTRPE